VRRRWAIDTDAHYKIIVLWVNMVEHKKIKRYEAQRKYKRIYSPQPIFNEQAKEDVMYYPRTESDLRISILQQTKSIVSFLHLYLFKSTWKAWCNHFQSIAKTRRITYIKSALLAKGLLIDYECPYTLSYINAQDDQSLNECIAEIQRVHALYVHAYGHEFPEIEQDFALMAFERTLYEYRTSRVPYKPIKFCMCSLPIFSYNDLTKNLYRMYEH